MIGAEDAGLPRGVALPAAIHAVDHAQVRAHRPLQLLHGAQLVQPAHPGAVRGGNRRGRKGRYGGCAFLGMADGLPRRLVCMGRLMSDVWCADLCLQNHKQTVNSLFTLFTCQFHWDGQPRFQETLPAPQRPGYGQGTSKKTGPDCQNGKSRGFGAQLLETVLVFGSFKAKRSQAQGGRHSISGGMGFEFIGYQQGDKCRDPSQPVSGNCSVQI
jgi:hypothetical protein